YGRTFGGLDRMRRLSAPALIILIFWSVSESQTTNGVISGTVLDPMNAVIANVSITVFNVRTGVTTTTTTNDAGIYTFASIQPGLYRMTAEAPNFQRYTLNDVTVEVGARLNINFSLVLTGAASSVEVKAVPDALLSTTASVGGVINGQKIQDL